MRYDRPSKKEFAYILAKVAFNNSTVCLKFTKIVKVKTLRLLLCQDPFSEEDETDNSLIR